jgi:UDP-glucose 4-epimerase
VERKLVITGVTGFLGSWIAQHFRQRGWVTLGVGTAAARECPVVGLSGYRQARFPDAGAAEWIAEQRPDAVVHCGGQSSVPESFVAPERGLDGAVRGTAEILGALRRSGSGAKFVLMSSAAVYGQPKRFPVREDAAVMPMSPYGRHKLEAETICREHVERGGAGASALRVFSAYGEGLRRQVVWDLVQRIRKSEERLEMLGTGEESRDFVHGLDVARAVEVVIAGAPMKGEVYNVGSGEETTIRELAEMLMAVMGKRLALSWVGERVEGYPVRWHADIGAISGLGYERGAGLRERLRSVVRWAEGMGAGRVVKGEARLAELAVR